jgi:hypothetical protein
MKPSHLSSGSSLLRIIPFLVIDCTNVVILLPIVLRLLHVLILLAVIQVWQLLGSIRLGIQLHGNPVLFLFFVCYVLPCPLVSPLVVAGVELLNLIRVLLFLYSCVRLLPAGIFSFLPIGFVFGCWDLLSAGQASPLGWSGVIPLMLSSQSFSLSGTCFIDLLASTRESLHYL